MSRWPVLILLVGCADPEPTVIAGVDAPLTVELVNPTTCSYCDPFERVDTLRVDVLRGEEVVASESFVYPGEAVELPALDGFGVVRIRLVGLGGGLVRSVGRTTEIALAPETPLTVPMLFLPANTTLPLGAEMYAERSRHVALRGRDGRVLVAGGVNPEREGTFASVERFDPATWSFSRFEGGDLPAGVGAARVAYAGTDEWLLLGGFVTSPSGDLASDTAAVWSLATDTLRPGPTLGTPRNGHCVAFYRDKIGILFGGTPSTDAGELLKLSEKTGDWELLNVPMHDFDQTLVSACVSLPDGSVFVQGDVAAATGRWSYDEGDTSVGEGFVPVEALGEGADRHVDGPLLVPFGDRVWIAGGADPVDGTAVDDARWFDPEPNGLLPATGLAAPRFDPSGDRWSEGDWVVLGGGWEDRDHLRAAPSVELVDPVAGRSGPSIPYDRDRNGATVTTLLDGTVLLLGGFDASDDGVLDAAVILPWVE